MMDEKDQDYKPKAEDIHPGEIKHDLKWSPYGDQSNKDAYELG